MLETILKLYVASQLGHVYSPMPHLFGPPGTNKSTVVAEAASLLGVNLHVMNVSRLSPLELEGLQMPVEENTRLHMLTATFWTQLKDGDILLLDEFLRGFPEVYNGLLDILTSRKVGGFELPNVFILGASNSTVAYDPALEDRLMHIPVQDIRNNVAARRQLGSIIADRIGLLPGIGTTPEMLDLVSQEISPMFDVLDRKGTAVGSVTNTGHSARHIIGQARLRHVTIPSLWDLLEFNNMRAMREAKPQFVVYPGAARPGGRTHGTGAQPSWIGQYRKQAANIADNPRLTDLQRTNINLNLQLIGMEDARSETKEKPSEFDDDILEQPF